jgi:hypothetical protein
MWYRVFCRSPVEVKPAGLLAFLPSQVVANFKGDDLGWTAAEFILGKGTPVYADRYLTGEDNLRDDLNTWAAWLETQDYSPNHGRLMQHVIQSQQLITIRKPIDHPNEVIVEDLCRTLCRVLAEAGDGIYQIEGDAWYSAAGELLLQEY